MKRITALLVVIFLGSVRGIFAQQLDTAHVGDVVRLSVRGHVQAIGKLEITAFDSIRVHDNYAGETLRVARSDRFELEVHRKSLHRRRNAMIGFVVGEAVGFWLVGTKGANPGTCDQPYAMCEGPMVYATLGNQLIFGTVFGLISAGVAYIATPGRWVSSTVSKPQ